MYFTRKVRKKAIIQNTIYTKYKIKKKIIRSILFGLSILQKETNNEIHYKK